MSARKLLLVISVLALASTALWADSFARIVRLSDVDGGVQIDRNTGHGFEKAIQNMPITQGVLLKTSANGHAEAEFEDGSVVRLTPDTTAEFSALSLRTDGTRVSGIKITSGTVYVNFRDKDKNDFKIWAGNRAIDLPKGAHLRVRVNGDDAEVAVFKGEAGIETGPETAKVKKNQTLRMSLNSTSQDVLAKGITPDAQDDWDTQRTQYLDQYASAKTYGSPYAYGYSDLYQYGSFFNAPGFGMVWRPSSFGPGWDPYGDGYWSFYPGSGYVWVSAYPWGWTPYRYGRWVYVPTYGWAWQPGGWNRWNAGVNVWNAPQNWHTPTTPGAGSGPTVVVGSPATIRPNRPIDRRVDVGVEHPGTGQGGAASGGGRSPRSVNVGPTPTPTGSNAQTTNQTGTTTTPANTQRTGRPDRSQDQSPIDWKGKRSVDTGSQNQPRTTPAPAPAPSSQPSRPSRDSGGPPPSRSTPPPPPPPAPAPAPRVEPARPAPIERPQIQRSERPDKG